MAQTITLQFVPRYELRINVNSAVYLATWSDGMHPGHPGITWTVGQLDVIWDDTHPELFALDANDLVIVDSR